jgi:hypothetical protein
MRRKFKIGSAGEWVGDFVTEDEACNAAERLAAKSESVVFVVRNTLFGPRYITAFPHHMEPLAREVWKKSSNLAGTIVSGRGSGL